MPIRYHVLASDYDGTLALHGNVDEKTVHALERCRLSGRRLLLVTGRELEELLTVFPRADLFDLIVAENGALLFDPATKEKTLLAEKPPEALISLLRERNVSPMSVGHVIIATWRPHKAAVLECIQELGFEMQVIFNKDAVMVLPSGVNKASGLKSALERMGLSPHNCVAVGDAENDHAFLSACEFGCAVENALPALKERSDLVTKADHGRGVTELIDALIEDDLARYGSHLARKYLTLGNRDGEPFLIDPYETSLLLTGSSGSGKSTLIAGFLEQLHERAYQFCIIDPEGDYQDLPYAVALGNASSPASPKEVLDLLSDPRKSAVVNLLGLPLNDRPGFFERLYPQLLEIRAATGHPHWIILDEAHHLLPASWERDNSRRQDLRGVALITVHPEHIPGRLLGGVNTFVVTGREPQSALAAFAHMVDVPVPQFDGDLPTGGVLAWRWKEKTPPVRLEAVNPRFEHSRHRRKYAEGKLDAERSFYFKGQGDKLNLKAHNLVMFMQIAAGIDEETWNFHLRLGDYSDWLRNKIGDSGLADEAANIEREASGDTRSLIREAIERRYTLPA